MKLTYSMIKALWECKRYEIAKGMGIRTYNDASQTSTKALRRRGLLGPNGITADGEQVLRGNYDNYERMVHCTREEYRFERDAKDYYMKSFDRVWAGLKVLLDGKVRGPLDDGHYGDTYLDWDGDGEWKVKLSILHYHDFTVRFDRVDIDTHVQEGKEVAFAQAFQLAQQVAKYLKDEYETHAPKRENYDTRMEG